MRGTWGCGWLLGRHRYSGGRPTCLWCGRGVGDATCGYGAALADGCLTCRRAIRRGMLLPPRTAKGRRGICVWRGELRTDFVCVHPRWERCLGRRERVCVRVGETVARGRVRPVGACACVVRIRFARHPGTDPPRDGDLLRAWIVICVWTALESDVRKVKYAGAWKPTCGVAYRRSIPSRPYTYTAPSNGRRARLGFTRQPPGPTRHAPARLCAPHRTATLDNIHLEANREAPRSYVLQPHQPSKPRTVHVTYPSSIRLRSPPSHKKMTCYP